MGIEKSEIKLGTLQELGVKFDDVRDSLLREIAQKEGAVYGLVEGAKAIESMKLHVNMDIDAGTYDLETAKSIKLYLDRSIDALHNLSRRIENDRILSSGKVVAMDAVIKITKKECDLEREKIHALAQQQQSTLRQEDVAGSHPGLSIKEERQLEDTPLTVVAPTPDPVSRTISLKDRRSRRLKKAENVTDAG